MLHDFAAMRPLAALEQVKPLPRVAISGRAGPISGALPLIAG
jgi:hypothetical protein